MDSSVASPGGFAKMRNFVVARKGYIGGIASTAAVGALAIYGLFQGAQAEHFIEAQLVSATANTVTYSALNPLPEGMSGAIMATPESVLFIDEVPSPQTRVSVCTATGAAQPCRKTTGSSNIMSGVYLNTAGRALNLSMTGGQLTSGGVPAILAPRDYANTARKYLNVTFTAGSGQTVSGRAPAFIRIKVTPCNLNGVGC